MIDEKYFNTSDLMNHFLKITVNNGVSILSVDSDTLIVAEHQDGESFVSAMVYDVRTGDCCMDAKIHYARNS